MSTIILHDDERKCKVFNLKTRVTSLTFDMIKENGGHLMKRKLIFFDVDGTIYDENQNIPQKTHEAIHRLKENGHILAIASGRAPFTLKHVMDDTEIENFVSYNGQYVVYDGEVIYKNPLDEPSLSRLEKLAEKLDHPMVFFSAEEVVSNVPHHNHIEDSLGSIKIDHPRFEEDYFKDREIFQALVFHDESEDELYDGKEEKLKYYRWHEVSRDVVPSNGSKAEGIKKFAEKLGFNQEDVIAVGDGNNDFEMIEWAGTGIVMGNGVEELKKIGDIVTDDVSQDGLYKAFVKLNMI